jgi:hypothetical protein
VASSPAYARARALAVVVIASCGLACAGTHPSSSGNGGSGGSSTGHGGSGGGSGSGGAGGAAAVGGGAGDVGNDAGPCQMLEFDAKTPSVFVLVDQSGSEFTNSTSGTFFTLRTAVEMVVNQLQGDIRFGLGVFTGIAGATCDLRYKQVAIDLNNAANIKSVYDPLGMPNFKAETPAVLVIPMVKAALMNDIGKGDKYMLFVTDSETDYCNDPGPACPADSVTWMIQDMYTSGIRTLVIGLPTTQTSISAQALQAFANAGLGQPVAEPPANGTNTTFTNIHDDCAQDANWSAIWSQQAHKTGSVPTAVYADQLHVTPGTAKVFSPSSTDTQALADQIATAVAGVKTCTFDLSSLTIDVTRLNEASVLIDGNVVPLDPTNTNGWDMVTGAELQLFGPACDGWRSKDAMDIKFNFPCDLVVQ